ncbi:hypothetical protein D9A12_16005 [Salmonella enterica]|nr:hypothetical protein [Salmonella enterica]EBJ1016703.1 hypothetical protein [Salmonella enterica]EBZ2101642.1 hypothetical protein [Salmonella enterica subsp. enterica serovar Chester]
MPLARHMSWFRDQVEAGRRQLECGDVLPHDMVEFSTAAWRDKMSRPVNDGDILDHADQPGQKTHS